jgi:hypothetical protein
MKKRLIGLILIAGVLITTCVTNPLYADIRSGGMYDLARETRRKVDETMREREEMLLTIPFRDCIFTTRQAVFLILRRRPPTSIARWSGDAHRQCAIKETRHNGHGGDRKGLASPEYRSGRVGYLRGTRGRRGLNTSFGRSVPQQKQIVFEE